MVFISKLRPPEWGEPGAGSTREAPKKWISNTTGHCIYEQHNSLYGPNSANQQPKILGGIFESEYLRTF